MRMGRRTGAAALLAASMLVLPATGWCDRGGRHGHDGGEDRQDGGYRGEGREYGEHGGDDGRHDDQYRGKKEKEGKRRSKHGERKAWVEWKGRGAPPPWAPAHGYRGKYYREHRDGREVILYRDVEVRTQVVPVPVPAPVPAYVAPYGIDAGRCNRQQVGQVLGGAVGGILGSQIGKGSGRTAAIIGGAVLGVLVGGNVGRTMDQIDQSCVGQVLEHAPTGTPVVWKDPDAGSTYQVTPTDTYEDPQGRYCREYQTTATIGGKRQDVYGTACRQPDGSWEIVK